MSTWINSILVGLIALCLSITLLLRNHIANLEDVINRLTIETRQKRVRRRRYNALLVGELSPTPDPDTIAYIPGDPVLSQDESDQIAREEHEAWLAEHPHRTDNGTLI